MMKNRQKHFFFKSIFFVAGILFCMPILHAVDTAAGEVMKVGYRTLAPHSIVGKDKAEPTGAAIDYLKDHIAPKMGVDIELILLPFSRLMAYLDEGKIDAVLLLGKNPERESKYLYPAEPVAVDHSGLALRKTDPLTEIKTADDLKDMNIGFTKDGFLSPFMKNKELRFEYTAGTETIWQQLLKKLDAKRIDAVYNPTLTTLKYEAKTIGLTDKIKFVELPEPSVDLYLVFSKSAKPLYEKFDSVHSSTRKIIPYQDILKKYLE